MKYVSGRVKELKVGISSHSESKTSLTVIGNANVSGSITATSFVGGGINTTGTSEFTNLDLSGYLNVAGVSTFAGNATFNGTANTVNNLLQVDGNTTLGVGESDNIDPRGQFVRALIPSGSSGTQSLGRDNRRWNVFGQDVSVAGVSTFTNTVNLGSSQRLNFSSANFAIYSGGSNLNLDAAGGGDVVITSNSSGGTAGDILLRSGSTEVLKVKGAGNIVGAATSNIIPFLYSNYSLFPSATTYHGAVAHAHNTGKLYYAHAANWIELVNKETNGTVGTGTEKYDIGITSVTNLRVAGISTYDGDLDVQSSVLITGITTIGGLVDINAGAQANTLKVEDLTDNRVVIAGTGGELEDDANLTFNGTTFNVGSAITMYQATGIISATSFFGDGSGLENTGSTLSEPSSGTQRLVTTSLTTGTMTSSGTGSELAFDYSNNHLEFTDNTKATFGTGNDLQLYHNATASYIDNNTGALYIRNNVDDDDGGNIIIQAKSGKTSAVFQDDEGVRLYYDDVEKVATTGYGVTVNGTTETQKLYVTGISTFTGLAKFNGNFEASGNVTLGSDANDRVTVNAEFNSDLRPSATHTYDLGDGTGYWKTLWIKNIYTNASGVSTFKGAIDADGHTELNTLNVTGVSTFAYVDINQGEIDGTLIGVNHRSNANFNYVDIFNDVDINDTTQSSSPTTGALKVDGGVGIVKNLNVGGTITGDGSGLTNLVIPGISTGGTSEFNNLNLSGIVTAAGAVFNTAKVSDLTDNRIVIAGTAGELEDTSKLTFDGTTLAIVGNATFTGNVSVAGTLTSEDKTNVDSIGIVTARTGVRISSGGLVVTSGVSTFTDTINANGNIAGDGSTNITGIAGVTASTLTGTLQTAAQPNITSLGTITNLVASSAKISDLTSGRVVYVGTAGELQDVSTFTFNGSTVTAPAFAGDGSALTGITAGGVGAIGGLTVKDEGVVVGTAGSISTLDFLGATVSVIANTGAAGIATVTIATEQKQDIQTLNVSGVSTFAGNTNITGDIVSDLTILSTDAGSSAGPIINLYRNSATPTDADYLGQIKFQGESDTGVQRNYAKITGKILDASNTDEDGILEFAFLKAGSNNISGRFRSDSLQLLNGTSLTVAGTAEVDGNITANGDIIGDGATNISGMNNVTATNFNSTSDARLKTNVQTITSPLEKLNQIDGVSFDWVEGYSDIPSSIGVIADTVEKVLPILVGNHASGFKSVNYNGLIGLLIEAVKEQQVQITELKSKLDSLS